MEQYKMNNWKDDPYGMDDLDYITLGLTVICSLRYVKMQRTVMKIVKRF